MLSRAPTPCPQLSPRAASSAWPRGRGRDGGSSKAAWPAPRVQPCVPLSPSLSPSAHSLEQTAASPVSPHGAGSPPSSLPARHRGARPLPAAPRAPILSSGQCAGHRACRNSESPGWDWKYWFHFPACPQGRRGVAGAWSGRQCRRRGHLSERWGQGSVSHGDLLGIRGK